MCGRFAFFSPAEAVARTFGLTVTASLEPRYNIAPSQQVAGLRLGESRELQAAMLKWGLVPFWAKDAAIGNRLINARAETLHEKPAFRNAFRRRRCMILADGFYEWQKTSAGKTPHYITPVAGGPFAMAGLWERWDRQEPPLESCIIITTPARGAVRPLHHRMPLIVPPAAARLWIDPAIEATEALAALQEAAAGEELETWKVSRAVNNPANEGPELLNPWKARSDCPGD
jgi:putative SOS response-associated peptidase YedK